MPRLDARRRREAALTIKLGSLRSEVEGWTKMVSGQVLGMHKSQIEVVSGGLTQMEALIRTQLEEACKAGPLTVDAVEGFERKILAALHIWQWYRDKFALRLVDFLQTPLAIVDDLAWHAYRAPRDAAVASEAVGPDKVREPPLLYPTAVERVRAHSRRGVRAR
jgi:hypothetical protein